MKHRFVRRVSALALAGCLLAGSSLPAFAAASAAKEEVIYANLTASGAVTGVYAVNSFSVQAGDTVADHGSYTAVRNMTTSDAVEQSGDTVTVHVTEDGKLYYEGTMDVATALPWVVKLTYTLDGAEIRPDELGGKSGALSIRLQVSRNPDCTGSFFDDYALQVTMSLDTGLARNIEAPGATVANVGSKKQLSYILLPGADSDVTVTADVTDFAMDAVSLNGVRLNLNLDLGDMDLTGMLEQLQSGSVQLDDGANALADGIAQVQAGIDTLNGNSGALTGGSARVRAALTQMQTALNGISASTDELNTLLDASTQIRDGIARLDEGAAQLEQQVSFEAYKAILKENGLDLDVVKDGNAKAIQQLQGMVWMMPQLKDVILLLQGSTANIDAMQTYLDTVNGGIAQLHEGSSTLNGSYGEFDAGVRQLAGVLTGMLGNLSVLTDGVNQLAAQYVQLDDGLNAYTDGVAQLKAGVAQLAEGASQLTGGTGELRSSVSGIDMGAQLDSLLNSLSGGGEVQSGRDFLRRDCFLPMACAYVYDRTMLERHGLGMLPMRHEDEEFTPRAIYFAKRIRYVPIRVYNYLQHNGSFMGSYDPKRRSDFVRAMKSLTDFAARIEESDPEGARLMRLHVGKTMFFACKQTILGRQGNAREMLRDARQRGVMPLAFRKYNFRHFLINRAPALFVLYYRLHKRR